VEITKFFLMAPFPRRPEKPIGKFREDAGAYPLEKMSLKSQRAFEDRKWVSYGGDI
jgi:hypothetical protein